MQRIRQRRPNRKHVLASVGIVLTSGLYWLLQRFFSPILSIGIIGAVLLLLAIIGGYLYNWRWTGVGRYDPCTARDARGCIRMDVARSPLGAQKVTKLRRANAR